MGILIAFAAGYVFGARAGSQDFDDVVQALQAIRESDEFHDLLRSLRSHAAHSLRELASMLDQANTDGSTAVQREHAGPRRAGQVAGRSRVIGSSVRSWPMPRNPTTSPAELRVGSARR